MNCNRIYSRKKLATRLMYRRAESQPSWYERAALCSLRKMIKSAYPEQKV